MKKRYGVGDSLQRGIGQFADLRGGGLGKKDGDSVFLGGLIPKYTLNININILRKLQEACRKPLGLFIRHLISHRLF